MYLFGLVERLAQHPDTLRTADDVFELLFAGIVLLPNIFNIQLPGDALARSPAIADLKVVRFVPHDNPYKPQQRVMVHYEAGEIADIQNVMRGESWERTHRRATTQEEIVVVETEREETREEDLQSAERV